MIKLATIRKVYSLRSAWVLPLFLPFFIASVVGKLIELAIIFSQHHFEHAKTIFGVAIIRESVFIGMIFWILFIFSPILYKRWFRAFIIFLLSAVLFFHVISTFYFVMTTEPISVLLLGFSFGEMTTIAGDYFVFKSFYLLAPVSVLIFWISLRVGRKWWRKWRWNLVWGLLPLCAFVPIPEKLSITEKDVAENKTLYFLETLKKELLPGQLTSVDEATLDYRASTDRNWGSKNYPFLHKKPTSASLAPFFELVDEPPNIVFIIVESLSSPYSGKQAENASFTPFLDSLAEHSLYFPNFLATAQRTFAVLPSALGSLPHGKRGFSALKNNYPIFYSLPEYLFENGYEGTFFYGGHAAFDDMNSFVTQTGFTKVIDREEFNYEGTSYQTSIDPVPFGVGDRALFQNSWEELDRRPKGPKLDVYLTLSMHYPFIFEEQEYYRDKAEKIIRTVEYSNKPMYSKMKKYTKELSSFLYTDDVLKEFFKNYENKEEFDNTIFIIMGDHMMTEIPQKDEVEKYRSPFMIYSPLLKRGKQVMAVNTQLDITPSLLALFESHYKWKVPNNVHWLGQDFDTLSSYRNERTVAFMMNNRTMKDFMHQGYFADGNSVHKMSDTGLFVVKEKIENPAVIELKNAYESLHRHVVFSNSLRPSFQVKKLIIESWEPIEDTIPENSEYFSLINTTIPSNFETAEVSMEMSIANFSPNDGSLLVFSVTKEEADTTIVRYWNKIMVKELLQETEEGNYSLSVNHRIMNNGLHIQPGDQFSVYFWNPDNGTMNYRLSKKNFRIYTHEN